MPKSGTQKQGHGNNPRSERNRKEKRQEKGDRDQLTGLAGPGAAFKCPGHLQMWTLTWKGTTNKDLGGGPRVVLAAPWCSHENCLAQRPHSNGREKDAPISRTNSNRGERLPRIEFFPKPRNSGSSA